MGQPPAPIHPVATASWAEAAARRARLAHLAEGLGLTEDELLSLGLELLAELFEEDPEVLRARVADTKAARSGR